MAADEKYCMCCGEEVPFNRISRNERLELTCTYCGFVLDIQKIEEEATADCVLVADDVELTQSLLKGILTKRGLAKTVHTFSNGQELVAAFTKRIAEGQPVDLIILDLEMPVMNGLTAARVLRAIEAKYGNEKSPILFFSARRCDEDLKKQMALFVPASYVNKGSDSEPERLIERIDQLVSYLLKPASAA
jgi:CheY-like chemotaxis protein